MDQETLLDALALIVIAIRGDGRRLRALRALDTLLDKDMKQRGLDVLSREEGR